MPRSTGERGRGDGGGTRFLWGERGFTLQELAVTMAIMGILAAIGVMVFLGILERWRVATATDQLVADLRLAHTSASNQLADWRVVMALGRGAEEVGPDYYLVKLAEPYEVGDGRPAVAESRPRTFPANVQVMAVRTASGYITDNQGAAYWVAPWETSPSIVPPTRTAEFNPDGSMRFASGPSGSVCVTVDDVPANRVYVLAATSRVRARSDAC